jgi:uncharacterized protein
MPTDLLFYLIGLPAVFFIGLGKGAFGGGLAIIGVPLLALAIDPIDATIVVALVASATDLFALRTFPMNTWSWPDMVWLAPALLLGTAIGALFFALMDLRVLVLCIAILTLFFALRYFFQTRAQSSSGTPVSGIKALTYGTVAGFATFVAHAGAAPLTVYLQERGLPKSTFVGTSIALLMMTNLVKLIPYGWFGIQRPSALLDALVLLPAAPIGVWIGKVMHDHIDQRKLYFWCYLLVGVAGTKLLIDSILNLVG